MSCIQPASGQLSSSGSASLNDELYNQFCSSSSSGLPQWSQSRRIDPDLIVEKVEDQEQEAEEELRKRQKGSRREASSDPQPVESRIKEPIIYKSPQLPPPGYKKKDSGMSTDSSNTDDNDEWKDVKAAWEQAYVMLYGQLNDDEEKNEQERLKKEFPAFWTGLKILEKDLRKALQKTEKMERKI